jgi:hypothetical protein
MTFAIAWVVLRRDRAAYSNLVDTAFMTPVLERE